MKRFGYLYERVLTPENIEAAWMAYNKNRPVAKRVKYDAARAAEILDAMTRDFAGVIGKPRVKYIYEGGKRRRLQIPSFRASIAMLAVWNVCGGYVERRIHPMSFASRKGKGGHLMAKKVRRFVRTHKDGDARYCLYFDIRKFYEHIDRRIVMDRLATVFKDRKILDMFRVILYSTDRGLSIGYPFSHSLANFFLSPLYYLLRSIKAVARVYVYMDNWNIFSRWKKPLHRAIASAKRWLGGVGCAVKHDWQIFATRTRAVRLCGLYIFARQADKLSPRLWRRTLAQFRRLADDWRKADYLGMVSRLGWLDLIGARFHPAFQIKGGYIWT